MSKIEVMCLGTGNHLATLTSRVNAATAFVVLINNIPIILVGCGPGVLRACYHYLGFIPSEIILLSTGVEQSSELAIAICAFCYEAKHVNIYSATGEADLIKNILNIQINFSDIEPFVHINNINSIELGSQSKICGEFSAFSYIHSKYSELLTKDNYSDNIKKSKLIAGIKLYFREKELVSFVGPTNAFISSQIIAWFTKAPCVFFWVCNPGVQMVDRIDYIKILEYIEYNKKEKTSDNFLISLDLDNKNKNTDNKDFFSDNIKCFYVLTGWGCQADEPVPIRLPSFTTFSCQGNIIKVMSEEYISTFPPFPPSPDQDSIIKIK